MSHVDTVFKWRHLLPNFRDGNGSGPSMDLVGLNSVGLGHIFCIFLGWVGSKYQISVCFP